MAYTEGKVLFSPSTADGMDITGADPASLNLDIDIIITEWLGLEFILVEFKPGLWAIDLEACECLRITHCELNEIWERYQSQVTSNRKTKEKRKERRNREGLRVLKCGGIISDPTIVAAGFSGVSDSPAEGQLLFADSSRNNVGGRGMCSTDWRLGESLAAGSRYFHHRESL